MPGMRWQRNLPTDITGRVTFLNTVAERLIGWPLEEVKNQPFERVFRIVNQYTGRPVENPVAKVLQSGGIVGLANHTVLITRDGQRVPIDDSGAPVRRAQGELIGIVVVFRDATERKRAEVERAWLASIVGGSDDVIVSKTLNGIVTSWNSGVRGARASRQHKRNGRLSDAGRGPEGVDHRVVNPNTPSQSAAGGLVRN
jgi:PAS domain S-box-containing protein